MNDKHRHPEGVGPEASSTLPNRPTRRSSLLENESFRRILSTRRFIVMLSTFLLALLLGLGALSFFQIGRIFDQLTPATARDLSWKAERGVAELSFTSELGVALAETERLQKATWSYVNDDDVQSLIIKDAEGNILFSHPKVPKNQQELFKGAANITHESESSYSAWAPVEIEGAEIGSVALRVSKDRLAAGDELRRSILASMVLGAIGALILAAFFVSFYIAPLIRLTERAFIDLEQRTREALESARLKSEFLANMSHEIRTPMNGVIGMAELLQKTPLSSKQRRYSRTITTSATALLTIINDILDFSKIEAGKLSVRPIETDIRRLVEEVAQLHAAQGNSKGVEVMCVISPDVPREVLVDHDRLRQVLNNVTSNAVKFTHEGNVVLRVWIEERAGDAAKRPVWRIGFSVTDTGIGIAPEDQERVFELFSQVDGSLTRTVGGTGLGLTISRHLVSLMGGQLSLQSELGKGSCFSFVIPLEVMDESSAMPTQGMPRTLIVDDNQTNLTVLEEILQMWGVPTESAHSGEEALAVVERTKSAGKKIDLVLVDYHLQSMLGTDLARAIREKTPNQKPRMVLLTSMSSVKSDEGLFDDNLTKPVLQEDLRRVVLGQGAARSDHSEFLTSLAFVGRPRILVAEDNPINREVMREILEELEIDADMAENGQQAIDALEHYNYPLILMDCQMPTLDGYEAARRIRARDDDKADVPIIAVTAHAVVGEREKAIAAGMSDYVTKPVTVTRLAKALAHYLETRVSERPEVSVDELEAHAALAAADLTRDGSLNPPPRSSRRPDAHLDPGTRRSKVVIGLFRKMVPEQIDLLEAAVVANDSSEVKKLAHKLKGSCFALGAKKMGAICAALEPLPGTATELLAELREEHQAVLGALELEERAAS